MDEIQREHLTKFIKFLHRSGDKSLVFQLFGEGTASGDRSLAKVLVNPGPGLLKVIDAAASRSVGVFAQVNGGKGRGGKYIEKVRAAFLDLDGAPLERVQEAVKAGYPKPHMVVESSPGRYHVYWRVVDITTQNFSYVQKTLAGMFDGDPVVHDLPRVMRVPGSYNFKHGELPHLVRVIHFKPDVEACTVAELMQPDVSTHLPPAPEFLQEQAQRNLTDSLELEGYNHESVAEITELKPGDRTQKIVRIAGALVEAHPDLPAAGIKELLVEEVDRRTPDGVRKVSSTAWETEIFPAVDRFVERRNEEREEIQSETQELVGSHHGEFEAFEASRSTDGLTMKDFSSRFVLVAADRLVYDLEKPASQTPMSMTAFREYAQVFTTSKGAPLLKNWLKDRALRQTVDTIMYKPYPHTSDTRKLKLQRITRNPDTGQLCYNTYATPKLSPVPPTDEMAQRRAIKPFMDHMAYLFPREDKREAFIDWVAATVQRPERRVQWAPFIISKHQGVGKGWIANLLQRLVGMSNYKFITMKEVEKGDFNDFLADSTVVVLDEVYAPRREDLVVKLQPMVTETAMEINRKYGAKGLQQIYCNMILFSNYEDALSLYATDRRFFVHMMDDEPRDETYYNRLWSYLDSPDLGGLLHWLLSRDISQFTWGRCPNIKGDESKARMLAASKSDAFIFLDSLRSAREGPFKYDILCKQVISHYIKMQYELDEVNTFDPKTLERDIKAWLRNEGTSIGTFSSIGKSRHNTWYDISDSKLHAKSSLKSKKDAMRSLKETYGEPSKVFQSIPKQERQLVEGEE